MGHTSTAERAAAAGRTNNNQNTSSGFKCTDTSSACTSREIEMAAGYESFQTLRNHPLLSFSTEPIQRNDREKDQSGCSCKAKIRVGCGSHLTCAATKVGIFYRFPLSITPAVPGSAAQMESITQPERLAGLITSPRKPPFRCVKYKC